ncbi:hypothetical protein N836_29025 [Leptolyngbya sp. Heron Island J]|uniref:hypothetical protein n=1 Tax=Leptolyngbya sp. Heron Island J TaxID=1385935 RepID=UPI0003B9E36C|nr:hypothetical protein [Leptolyngbya sp. Heron Island J]ESA39000.1 hypothetical protein N836_29025 [Leptolyngbya sp. Heron Island J]
MKKNPRLLTAETVVRLDDQNMGLGKGQTFLASESTDFIGRHIRNSATRDAWVKEGVPCQAMAPTGKWIKGRVRYALIFEPDSASEKS